MSPATPASPVSRAGIGFVVITVLLDVMALGITIPVLPRLVEGMMGGDKVQAALMLVAAIIATRPVRLADPRPAV